VRFLASAVSAPLRKFRHATLLSVASPLAAQTTLSCGASAATLGSCKRTTSARAPVDGPARQALARQRAAACAEAEISVVVRQSQEAEPTNYLLYGKPKD
jgi:hypothetical protein